MCGSESARDLGRVAQFRGYCPFRHSPYLLVAVVVPKSSYCLFRPEKLQGFCWNFSMVSSHPGLPRTEGFPGIWDFSAKTGISLEKLGWLITLSFSHSVGFRLWLKTYTQSVPIFSSRLFLFLIISQFLQSIVFLYFVQSL